MTVRTSVLRFTAALSLGILLSACVAAMADDSPPIEPVTGASSVAVVGDGTSSEPPAQVPGPEAGASSDSGELFYTTYFYTAAEAVVHGYENGTNVRIVSVADGGTIWHGTVERGETQLIPTGAGVFGFLADKKAAILVGTPSACTAVGYWVRDQEGAFRGDDFFTQLPSSISAADARVIVWSWDDTQVTIRNQTTGTEVWSGSIERGSYHEILSPALGGMANQVLHIEAEAANVAVQVYYDEGFAVPSEDGRASGTRFYTYVGDITQGRNDLALISYYTDANVRVRDINDGSEIWAGVLEAGTAHNLTLIRRHVEITSDVDISAYVAPLAEIEASGGYAEHHFSMGGEGTGIENDFILPTPAELWVFSYFDGSDVTVTDLRDGEQVWAGTLNAGSVHGLTVAGGVYRVRSTRGISVQGGQYACGAEYSPAAGLFAVDETLLSVVREVQARRIEAARAEGREATADELAAPLAADELEDAVQRVRATSGNGAYSPAEVQQRLDRIQQ